MFGGFRKKDRSKNGQAGDARGKKGADGKEGMRGEIGAPAGRFAEGDRFSGLTLLTAMSLKDVSPSEQPKLFVRHLQLCHEVFDFNEMERLKEKEAKRLLLLGLVDYLNNPNTKVYEWMFSDIVSMVSANLFRALPPKQQSIGDAEEDEPALDSAWPHLQFVYEFLLRFVVSSDVEPKVAKKYITQAFIVRLLELFNSEDLRERDYLKTILHRIYGKFMALRAFIRKAIAHIFHSCVYFGDEHNGIAELLEILGSIINGFALPLKVEHKRFLTTCLIPLHKAAGLASFHQQLEYCVTQFVEKDNKVAEPVILGLLRYWPETNSPKQLHFLHEVEEILELVQLPEFRNVMVPLFTRISMCLESQHFQVAESALLLWNNEYLFTLVTQNRKEILPLVYDVLHRNSEAHWNSSVQQLSINVLKSFEDNDKTFYDEVCKQASVRSVTSKSKTREELWRSFEMQFEVEVTRNYQEPEEPPQPPNESFSASSGTSDDLDKISNHVPFRSSSSSSNNNVTS